MTKQDWQEGLTEREELLLSQYFDGECGFMARRSAEKLISSNPLARDFLASLESAGSTCRAAAQESAVSADLWSRIDARIESEERAAFYLGERRRDAEPQSFLSRLRSRQALWGGLSGALAAAVVLVFFVAPVGKSSSGALLPGQPFHQAAVGGLAAEPASLTSNPRSAMEVDWMRANGSLKLFQDPSGKSATIWVRRRPAAARAVKAAQATPGISATPHLYLDGRAR
mgnify:CR=1 FL=1